MPELPEVESVARNLREIMRGRTFLKAQLLRPGLAPGTTPRSFAASLRGAGVIDVTRRGKNILAHLSNGRTLITHLRMTGRFIFVGESHPLTRHAHAVFFLDNHRKLIFDDQRHFGVMELCRTDELDCAKRLSKLAPEPFGEEFSDEYLLRVLKKSSQQIKLTLLDQSKVLGLGNIYASEALFRAKIDPRSPACKISKPRAAILRKEIIAVLSEAIANNRRFDPEEEGAIDLDASYGGYQAIAMVYEREGEPCRICLTPIRRFTQGARSTYYCSKCQQRRPR